MPEEELKKKPKTESVLGSEIDPATMASLEKSTEQPPNNNLDSAEEKLAAALETEPEINPKAVTEESTEQEKTSKETGIEVASVPVLEKELPIQPPKEGLAPEQPRPTYSSGEVNPNNIASMVPGAERPGMDPTELMKQAETSSQVPLDQVKKGMKGKGNLHEISAQAEQQHNGNKEEEKAA